MMHAVGDHCTQYLLLLLLLRCTGTVTSSPRQPAACSQSWCHQVSCLRLLLLWLLYETKCNEQNRVETHTVTCEFADHCMLSR
jgi:hypothetical protein